jgi:hypothetical protein
MTMTTSGTGAPPVSQKLLLIRKVRLLRLALVQPKKFVVTLWSRVRHMLLARHVSKSAQYTVVLLRRQTLKHRQLIIGAHPSSLVAAYGTRLPKLQLPTLGV